MIWTRLFQVFFMGGVAVVTVITVRMLWQDWRGHDG